MRALSCEAHACTMGNNDNQRDKPVAEAKALVEEGVPIAPLPLPVIPPDQTN